MCMLCGDVIASCYKVECGALTPLDEHGNRRFRWMRNYTFNEIPCEHALAGHESTCDLHVGLFCSCDD